MNTQIVPNNAKREVSFVQVKYYWHVENNCAINIHNYTGCGRLSPIDGNWKLCYPVCMWKTPMQVQGFEGRLKYVDTCPNSPMYGMAFCSSHCQEAKSRSIPTIFRDYLRYSGANKGTS